MMRLRLLLPAMCELVFLLLVLLLPSPLSAMPDTNHDGAVDVVDVQTVVGLVLSTASPSWPGQGDVNADSQVDVLDVQSLVSDILGISQPLSLAPVHVLPVADLGLPYVARLSALGGVRPHAWTYTGVLPPGLTLSADGALTGIPLPSGVFSFEASVLDGLGVRRTSAITVRVLAPNQPPVAGNDAYVYSPGIPLVVPAPGVLGNDADPDMEPLTLTLLSPPGQGLLTLNNDGSFTFVLGSAALPTVGFTYQVADPRNGTATAMVTLSGTNTPPSAVFDAYFVESGETLVVSGSGVLANDSDPDGHALSAELVQGPSYGSMTMTAQGAFTYVSPLDISLVDEFSYLAKDGWGGQSLAVVRIMVHQAFIGTSRVHCQPIPAPAKAGLPVLIRASFFPSGGTTSSASTYSSVTATGSGLPPAGVHLSPVPSMTGMGLHTFEATILAPAAWGLHHCTVTAQPLSGAPITAPLTLVVYTGTAIVVGPTQVIFNLESGLAVAQAGDCVLLDPGTYSLAAAIDLQGTKMLAGKDGWVTTKVDLNGQSFQVFNNIGPGRETIVTGLTFEDGLNRVANSQGSFTLHQCRITGFTSSGHGGAFLLSSSQSRPLFNEVVIDNCVIGVPALTSTVQQWGGALALYSGAGLDAFRCTFRGNACHNRNQSRGGCFYVQDYPSEVVLDECRFLNNMARTGSTVYGGAISGGLISLDLSRTEFRGNSAVSVPVPINETDFTYGLAHGGAVSLAFHPGVPNPPTGAAPYTGQTRWLDCKFDSNTAVGPQASYGGAGYLYLGGPARMTSCSFEANMAGTASTSARGGALELKDNQVVRIESCAFTGNVSSATLNSPSASLPAASGGGAISLRGNTGILELFHTVFSGCQANVGGALAASNASIVIADQCRWIGNQATGVSHLFMQRLGGAVILDSDVNAHFWHCTFHANTSTMYGGALSSLAANSGSSGDTAGVAQLYNCLLTENSAALGGAAIALDSVAAPAGMVQALELRFCTFAGNASAAAGGGDAIRTWTLPVGIENSILHSQSIVVVAGASGAASYSCNNLPLPSNWITAGNLASPPSFVLGPLGAFYLASTSSCVDTGSVLGTPSSLLAATTTQVSEVPDTGNPDIGFHFPVSTSPVVPRALLTWQASRLQWPSPGPYQPSMSQSVPPLLVYPAP